jgi:hypothetical protein
VEVVVEQKSPAAVPPGFVAVNRSATVSWECTMKRKVESNGDAQDAHSLSIIFPGITNITT